MLTKFICIHHSTVNKIVLTVENGGHPFYLFGEIISTSGLIWPIPQNTRYLSFNLIIDTLDFNKKFSCTHIKSKVLTSNINNLVLLHD